MADDADTAKRHVTVKKIYLKDLSFVSPQAPGVFSGIDDADRLLNIRSTNSEVAPEHVEVTLTVAVKAVSGEDEDEIFQVEVVQAGVFQITGYTPEERVEILGRVCPEILFPFARDLIDGVTRRAGFPGTLLAPLDFHALFAQNMRERAAQSAES